MFKIRFVFVAAILILSLGIHSVFSAGGSGRTEEKYPLLAQAGQDQGVGQGQGNGQEGGQGQGRGGGREKGGEVTTIFAGSTPAQISLSGEAFPGAKVAIFAFFDKEIILKQDFIVSQYGFFSESLNSLPTLPPKFNYYKLGLLIEDKDGRKTPAKIYKYDPSLTPTLIVSDILTAPTIGFLEDSIKRGRVAEIIGYAAPGSDIQFELDGKIIKTGSKAVSDGSYKFSLDTTELSIGNHIIRAKESIRGKVSDYSTSRLFKVVQFSIPQADLDNDGIIDIKDAMIFMSIWFSGDANAKKQIDFDGDGRVDMKDFSILLGQLNEK